jgi:hypothetical protein
MLRRLAAQSVEFGHAFFWCAAMHHALVRFVPPQ